MDQLKIWTDVCLNFGWFVPISKIQKVPQALIYCKHPEKLLSYALSSHVLYRHTGNISLTV